MKLALIPWSDEEVHDDNIFYPKTEDYMDYHILCKRALDDAGYELHTIDMYQDLSEVDIFLFGKLDYPWLNLLARLGRLQDCIYISSEPAVVIPWNSKEGYDKLLRWFSCVMTWDDALVDNKRIFKRIIPYYFKKEFGQTPFAERKLMTNISGNKSSSHEKELYSERERVITWFEENHLGDFDLYGFGWDKDRHLSYQGTVKSKTETYYKYKFALCLENMHHVSGYITEKIYDCLRAGIVPVYEGADNITEFVPQDCFIPYSSFGSTEELYEFLSGMTEETWQTYVDATVRFFVSHNDRDYAPEVLRDNIIHAIEGRSRDTINLTADDRREIAKCARKEVFDRKMLHFRIWASRIIHRK